jgi:hypothetical protein
MIVYRKAFDVELGFGCEVGVDLTLCSNEGWISFERVRRGPEHTGVIDESEVMFGGKRSLGGDVSLSG